MARGRDAAERRERELLAVRLGGVTLTGAIEAAAICVARDDERALVGAPVELAPSNETTAEALFGEAPSRVVASCDEAHLVEIEKLARAHDVGFWRLGTTGGDRLVIHRGRGGLVDVDLASLREARERCLESIVGA